MNEVQSKEFCPRPFEEIEINRFGDVHTCCPNWNNAYTIGNIYRDTLEGVWNSNKAIDLRKRVMNKDYSLCDKQSCAYLKQNFFPTPYDIEYKPVMTQYPQVVKFVYDFECNIACRICRDHIKRHTDEELEFLNSRIEPVLLPLLQSAKKLIINAYGDPFGSRHSRLVIQKAAEKYPDLKFDFHTNGILCNEENFKALNITPEKIDKIRISIHAASAKTYGKVVPNGEVLFPKIIQNLYYLKELRKTYNFPVFIHFVISSLNYTEIPQFIEIAEKVNASPHFWEYRRENCSYEEKEDVYIARKDHPLHSKLVEVLKHPKVKEYKDNFSPEIYDLIE